MKQKEDYLEIEDDLSASLTRPCFNVFTLKFKYMPIIYIFNISIDDVTSNETHHDDNAEKIIMIITIIMNHYHHSL